MGLALLAAGITSLGTLYVPGLCLILAGIIAIILSIVSEARQKPASSRKINFLFYSDHGFTEGNLLIHNGKVIGSDQEWSGCIRNILI